MDTLNASDQPLPRLLPTLEAVPIEHQGSPMVLLRDTEESNDAFMLSPAGMLLISFLDGKNTIADLRRQFAQQTGLALRDNEIRELLRRLENTNLLETLETRRRREEKRNAFLNSPTRPAVHCPGVYPAEALPLTQLLNAFFIDPKGPGKSRQTLPGNAAPPIGLLAPHIDFRRGGPAYAWAYGALADCPPPDAIIALGVAHASPQSPWVMTPKNYETPYGPMAVHRELSEQIQRELWYDSREEESVHRREHSLEFQAVWLKYLWGDRTPPWVPILTSTFERFAGDRAPSSFKAVEQAIAAVGERLRRRAEAGERILILGGVDFAHVGPRFGDKFDLGPETKTRIEAADRAALDSALGLKADDFYLAGVGSGAWRKVCGLSATYTVLRWISAINPRASGTLLAYDQAPDPVGGIVSFAGVRFD